MEIGKNKPWIIQVTAGIQKCIWYVNTHFVGKVTYACNLLSIWQSTCKENTKGSKEPLEKKTICTFKNTNLK